MNSRYLLKEINRVLKDKKRHSPGTMSAFKDKTRLHEIVRTMHNIPTLDDRPTDEILYDEDGLPK